MDETERKLDFHALGLAIKEAREKKRWTQAYLGELVGRTDRTIMSIENKGQFPSLNVFYQLVTLLETSVDQYFFPGNGNRDSQCRQHIDRMLDSMNEKELTIIEATAEGIEKARETEVQN